MLVSSILELTFPKSELRLEGAHAQVDTQFTDSGVTKCLMTCPESNGSGRNRLSGACGAQSLRAHQTNLAIHLISDGEPLLYVSINIFH